MMAARNIHGVNNGLTTKKYVQEMIITIRLIVRKGVGAFGLVMISLDHGCVRLFISNRIQIFD
jgi:hypothetical protein